MAKKKLSKYKPADPEFVKKFVESAKKDWGPMALLGSEIDEDEAMPISTGSTKLDWALTKPLVEGTINEIYGENRSGKTTMSLEIAAQAQKMGKMVFFFDLERKLVNASLNMIKGLNRDLFLRVRPENGEDAVNKVHKCVSEVPGCVVIFDSLTQLLPEVEDAEGAQKQSMGLVARLAAKMVRKILGPVERNRCMVLFISHITTDMNPYSSGDKTKGGKAVPDIAAQRIRVKALASGFIKNEDGDAIGQNTKCKVIKNNQGLPMKEVTVPIIWGKGIDRTLDLIEIAKDLSIVDYKPQGGWYTYYQLDGQECKGHESDLRELIKNNPEWRDDAIRQVKELLG